MANYEIDPGILKKYIPAGTELDIWNDKYYVSLVGFMFLKTKLRGITIPFHSNFSPKSICDSMFATSQEMIGKEE